MCRRLVIHFTTKVSLGPSLPPSFCLSLSLFPSLSSLLFLSLSICFRGQCCSGLVLLAVLIVCYFFNTYIMYFIRICCQPLSVPLHLITLICFLFFFGGGSWHHKRLACILLLVMHLTLSSLVCAFLPLPGIQLSWLLFYEVVLTSDDGFIISSPGLTAL